MYILDRWLQTQRKIQRLVERSPFPPEPLSPKQRLLNKSSHKECTSNMTAWYCSNTEPCFQRKGNRPRCLLELSIRLWPLQKEQCGKDRQHHNVCKCPSQTRSTQHASFSNQRVMYSTTVTLFSQIDHYIQKPCAAAVVGTGRWDEKVHYSYITLAQMVSTLFLQMVITEYKCTSYKRVVNGYTFFLLSYSNILWSTSRHQWQQQQKYKVRTRRNTNFFF